MEDKKYVMFLKNILTQKEFEKLSNEIYISVNEKFKSANKEQADNIVNLNIAAIVVYANEKLKGCKMREFNTRFYSYNIGPRIFLVERAIGKFEKRFNYYIKKTTVYITNNQNIET